MKSNFSDSSQSALLLQKMGEGCELSFRILYEKYWENAYAAAYKRLKDADQAKDIIQETFTHIWFKRETLLIDNLGAYLHVAVRNRAFKHLSKQRLMHPFFDMLESLRSLNNWATRAVVAAAILIIIALSVFCLTDQQSSSIKPAVANSTDKKQHHLFYLPDGSMVILSHVSKLEIVHAFNKSQTREIYLEGQAFFDIHHDPSKLFIVHTNKITTTVMGTAFNVKALDSDQQVIVTVSRGNEKVSDTNKTLDLLTQDQQIVYQKKNGNAVKSHVHAADYLQWKDWEDLLLDNVTFGEAAFIGRQIRRIYFLP